MRIFTESIIMLTLLLIAWEDCKERLISFYLLLVLFAVSMTHAILYGSLQTAFWNLGINSMVILCLLGGLLLYYRIKEGAPVNLFGTKLGTGDLLFWIAFCPMLAPPVFILFFTGSLFFIVLALLIAYLIKPAAGWHRQHLPLAGLQAVLLCILLSVNLFFWRLHFTDGNTIFIKLLD